VTEILCLLVEGQMVPSQVMCWC